MTSQASLPAQSMTDCLQGLRVVDLTRNLPGPFATRLLADLGAEVIKVEPINGDPARAIGELFAALNHGKETGKYDFRKTEDIERIKQHLKHADVMLDSFRPGVLTSLGLDAESLHLINPKLIIVSITGYGVDKADETQHQWAQKAGHDLNFMAMSGVLDQLRTADGQLAMPNIQFADLAGGSDTAVIAILAAVFAAQRTGKGRHVVVSMTHSLYKHLVMPKATGKLVKALTGKTPQPQHDFLGGVLPCYRLYKTSDDSYMAVAALELKFWKMLCDALDLPELKAQHWQLGVMPNNPKSLEVAATLADMFSKQPRKHWEAIFASVDACVTPVLTLEEAKEHPLFAHQDKYYETSGWQVVD